MPSSPSNNEWNNLVKIYAVASVVLFLKYTISLFYAANSDNHPSEDKMFLLPPPPSDLLRRERQFVNDMENIPIHMAIFWAAFIVQNFQNASGNGGRIGTLGLSALIIIYVLSRVFFTICYVRAIQPFRTLFYIMGTLSVLIACGFLIYSSIQLDMASAFEFRAAFSTVK